MWYYLWILSRWTLNVVHCFRSGNNIANVLPSEHCIWSTVTKGMGCWLFTLHLIVKCDLSSSTTSFPLLTLTAAQSSPCLQTSSVLTYVTVVTGWVAFLFVHDMKSILVIDLHCDTHASSRQLFIIGKSHLPNLCYQHFLCRNQMLYSIQKRKLPLVCNVYAYLHTKMLLKLFRP